MTLGDVLYATQEGAPKSKVPMLYEPYLYDLVVVNSFKNVAHTVKDRYSLGIVILEIIVGTEMVLAATSELDMEHLLRDCCPYLDPTT